MNDDLEYSGNYANLFSARSSDNSSERAHVQELEARITKLELVTEALWHLLRDKTNLTEVDLLEMVTKVDLRDGCYDGKAAKVPYVVCSQCNRKNSKRNKACIYCSEPILIGPFD